MRIVFSFLTPLKVSGTYNITAKKECNCPAREFNTKCFDLSKVFLYIHDGFTPIRAKIKILTRVKISKWSLRRSGVVFLLTAFLINSVIVLNVIPNTCTNNQSIA